MAADDPIDFNDPRDPRPVLARLKAENPERFKDDAPPRSTRRALKGKRRGRPPGQPKIKSLDPKQFKSVPEPAGPPEPLWSRSDYATYLRVHETTLYRLDREGRLAPGLRLSANIRRWRPSVVRAFHAAQEAQTAD
jgi:hypothetical protein